MMLSCLIPKDSSLSCLQYMSKTHTLRVSWHPSVHWWNINITPVFSRNVEFGYLSRKSSIWSYEYWSFHLRTLEGENDLKRHSKIFLSPHMFMTAGSTSLNLSGSFEFPPKSIVWPGLFLRCGWRKIFFYHWHEGFVCFFGLVFCHTEGYELELFWIGWGCKPAMVQNNRPSKWDHDRI